MSSDPLKPLPPHRPAISGRTVEITDEDETIIVAFVPVDRDTSFTDKPNHNKKEILP